MAAPLTACLRFLACLLLAIACTQARADDTVKVLFVGNSLTYANNLPRLVQAIAASQETGPRIATTTFAIPGAELDELWDAGHAATALREGDFDVVVLQERGGLLRCMAMHRGEPECRRSERAHRDFVALADARGARVLLLVAWPPMRPATLRDPRRRNALKEGTLRAYTLLAGRLGSAGGAEIGLVRAAPLLVELAAARGAEQVLQDDVHPTVLGSLAMAAQLYEAVAARPPQARKLVLDFPLLPANAAVQADAPVETQPQLAGDGQRVEVAGEALAPLFAAARGD